MADGEGDKPDEKLLNDITNPNADDTLPESAIGKISLDYFAAIN